MVNVVNVVNSSGKFIFIVNYFTRAVNCIEAAEAAASAKFKKGPQKASDALSRNNGNQLFKEACK